MTLSIEHALVIGGILFVVSIFASKTSGRTGVPALLLFLLIGMIAGSEGLGGLYFDNYHAAQSVGIVALIYILFSGGLDANIGPIRSVALAGGMLSTLGVIITSVMVGIFSRYVLGFEWLQALLLGAIVSSTDAAAVFTVLRSKGLGLKNRLKPLLELESGSNDPMAVLLTVTLISIISTASLDPLQITFNFLQQILVGAAFGFSFGKLAGWILNKINLEFEGLYPVLTISFVALSFGLSQIAGGNGFLTVYLLGLTLAQSKFVHKRSIVIFHDGVAWLSQIVMFLCLGLLVFPSQLLPLAGPGILLSAFLILAARPLAVFLCLPKQGYSTREKLYISWVGLRGSVPIILATYPLVAGVAEANKIFNLVFFVVVASVALQGTTLSQMAKLLGVDSKEKPRHRYPIEFIPDTTNKNDLVEIEVPENSHQIGKSLVQMQLPKNTLIVLMQRAGLTFVPNGSTVIEKGDSLLVLAEAQQLKELRTLLTGY